MTISIAALLCLERRGEHGEPFDLKIWTWWLDRLIALVNGFTDRGVVRGFWHGYTDENREIVIVVPSTEQIDAIRGLLKEARIRFRQEAMYLEYHEVYFDEIR